MSMTGEGHSEPRFIKPPNKLKQKVGNGGIDEALLEQGQHFIESTDLDFVPIAREFLEELTRYAEDAKSGKLKPEEGLEKIVQPVMQLKANGGMFRYQLVSDVADIALQFLENVDAINEDGLEVIRAHENAIQVIIGNKLRGDGGAEGYALVKELHEACKRYFVKHKPKDKKTGKKKTKTGKKK